MNKVGGLDLRVVPNVSTTTVSPSIRKDSKGYFVYVSAMKRAMTFQKERTTTITVKMYITDEMDIQNMDAFITN